MSFYVAQRPPEFGLRMALAAILIPAHRAASASPMTALWTE